MHFTELPEKEREIITILLRDTKKLFALAAERPELFEKYENMIFTLAQPDPQATPKKKAK